MNKQKTGGFGFYFVILILMAFIWYFISTLGMSNADYKYEDFKQDLVEGQIKKVVVVPSQYGTNGSLEITFKDKKTTVELFVTDTEKPQQDMEEAEFFNYTIDEVEGESVLLTTVLPLGISVVAIIFIFMMFSGNASSGGGGGKMMNFGKSRAKLMNESNKKVTNKTINISNFCDFGFWVFIISSSLSSEEINILSLSDGTYGS